MQVYGVGVGGGFLKCRRLFLLYPAHLTSRCDLSDVGRRIE